MPARYLTICIFSVIVPVTCVSAQSALPVVSDVDSSRFAAHAERLIKAMKEVSLDTGELERDLKDLGGAADKAEVLKVIQKRLDRCCLLGISINPESRVKVARGSAEAMLVKDQDNYFLIKIDNDAGVTSTVALRGPQIIQPDESGAGRWLEIAVTKVGGVTVSLTGERLQYVIVRLRPREAGKREATLCCDVGQGTQDLGFRAELPILFVVKEK
jgi:hypothetical protein